MGLSSTPNTKTPALDAIMPYAQAVLRNNKGKKLTPAEASRQIAAARAAANRTAAPSAAPAKPATKATSSAGGTKDRGTQKTDSAPLSASDPVNDRFGNDMAWLDPIFQQEAALVGDSQQAQAYADPEAIKAQKAALDQLMGIANGGGATDIERARMANARDEQESWLRGQREADLQNAAERGMSGSGSELADLAMDRQAAGDRLSNSSLQTQAMLQQRAMDALMAGGNLASGMRGSSYAEESGRGQAADQFKMLNQQALNNIGSQNKQFIQNAWGDMINRRNAWDQNTLNQQIGAAQGLQASDIGQNEAGYQYGGGQGARDAAKQTEAQQNQNVAQIGYQNTTDALTQPLYGESREKEADTINSGGKLASSVGQLGFGGF